eukprot:5666003-Pleurochrysis_carterae.AAC.1
MESAGVQVQRRGHVNRVVAAVGPWAVAPAGRFSWPGVDEPQLPRSRSGGARAHGAADEASKHGSEARAAGIVPCSASMMSMYRRYSASTRSCCAAGVIVGAALALVKEPIVARDAERVLGALLKVVLVVRRRVVTGRAAEPSGCQGRGDHGGRVRRGEVVASTVLSPKLVQVDRVPKLALGIRGGRRPAGRGAIARLPSVAGEAEKREGFGFVRLLDVLGVFVPRVGIGDTELDGSCSVRGWWARVQIVAIAVLEPLPALARLDTLSCSIFPFEIAGPLTFLVAQRRIRVWGRVVRFEVAAGLNAEGGAVAGGTVSSEVDGSGLAAWVEKRFNTHAEAVTVVVVVSLSR